MYIYYSGCIHPQKEAFQCSAKCCEDEHCSQEVLQRCIQSCMRPMVEAEQSLKSEVEQFQVSCKHCHIHIISYTTKFCSDVIGCVTSVQGRLTRCAQTCEDECRDMVPPNASQQDMDKVQRHAERCLMKCADDNISRIPQFIDRFRRSLGNSSRSGKLW